MAWQSEPPGQAGGPCRAAAEGTQRESGELEGLRNRNRNLSRCHFLGVFITSVRASQAAGALSATLFVHGFAPFFRAPVRYVPRIASAVHAHGGSET